MIDSITIDPISVLPNLENKSLSFYPNPNYGNGLFIEAKGYKYPLKGRIVNQQGQVVSNFELVAEETELSIAHLSKGMYFVEFVGEDIMIKRKIIKM